MTIKKIFLVVVGCISLGIGAVGAVLPFLPTFPFLMLTAICFTASSERLNNWFKSTKLYKNNLESYVEKRGMTKATKIKIMLIVTILMGFGFYMMHAVPVGRVAIVWLGHMLYFGFRVKTIQ